MIMLLILIAVALAVTALVVKPLRKALGLLLILLRFISCLTVVGLVWGAPTILIGGILMFI